MTSNVVRKCSAVLSLSVVGAAGDLASVGSRWIPGQGCGAGTGASSLPTAQAQQRDRDPLSTPASSGMSLQ